MSKYKFKRDVKVPSNVSVGFFSFVKEHIQNNLIFEGCDVGEYVFVDGSQEVRYKFDKEWLILEGPGIETWKEIHYRLNETFKSDKFMNLDHIGELIKAGEKNQAKRINLVVEAARKIFMHPTEYHDRAVNLERQNINEIFEALERLEE